MILAILLNALRAGLPLQGIARPVDNPDNLRKTPSARGSGRTYLWSFTKGSAGMARSIINNWKSGRFAAGQGPIRSGKHTGYDCPSRPPWPSGPWPPQLRRPSRPKLDARRPPEWRGSMLARTTRHPTAAAAPRTGPRLSWRRRSPRRCPRRPVALGRAGAGCRPDRRDTRWQSGWS